MRHSCERHRSEMRVSSRRNAHFGLLRRQCLCKTSVSSRRNAHFYKTDDSCERHRSETCVSSRRNAHFWFTTTPVPLQNERFVSTKRSFLQNRCRAKCSTPAFGREAEIRPQEGPPKHPLGRLKNGCFARYCRKFPACWHGSISSKTSVSCRRNALFCETDVKQQGVKRVQNHNFN